MFRAMLSGVIYHLPLGRKLYFKKIEKDCVPDEFQMKKGWRLGKGAAKACFSKYFCWN